MPYLWLCAHFLLGLEFPRLPACPSPSLRLLVYLFKWVLFSTRVPYLHDGVTPAGSRIVCPRSERRFSVPIWGRYTGRFLDGPHTSVCGVSARPVPQGVLPSGPRCVHELRLSLALSGVLHCPMLGFSVASPTLATCLGLEPRSVARALRPAAAGALFPGGPHCSCRSWEVLGSLHGAPLTVGPLPGPPALHCLLSAGCLLVLETSPSGETSASA